MPYLKKNFYNLKNLKNYKIVFNEFGRPLTQEDLQKIFIKYPKIVGIIAGLERYNKVSLKNQKI